MKKSNFIIIDSLRLKLGELLKQFSIFLLCCIVTFTSSLSVHASEPTATPGGSSSGEYVTVEVPLAWTINKFLSYTDGGEIASTTGSITGYISVIPDAQYTVNQTRKGVVNGSNAFYYTGTKGFIDYQELWNNVSTLQEVSLTIPAGCEYFRLTSDLNFDGDSTQRDVYLAITVSATYMEENDLTEDTLLDVVYKNDDRAIADSADEFAEEYDNLHLQEDYLMSESKLVFDDFFASFSFSDLAEYSAGFSFIGVWFSNFYNAHPALAVSVGMSAGLTLLFVLLRFRGH